MASLDVAQHEGRLLVIDKLPQAPRRNPQLAVGPFVYAQLAAEKNIFTYSVQGCKCIHPDMFLFTKQETYKNLGLFYPRGAGEIVGLSGLFPGVLFVDRRRQTDESGVSW